MINFKHNTLGKTIAAILASSAALVVMTPIYAAQEPQTLAEQQVEKNPAPAELESEISDTEADESGVEVIEVSGMRFSQLKALDRKKNGGTMMDSLVAEDIGQFPDKNVAEALQRIPGVQLSRDFGEGNQISLRGVEPDLVKVEVNNVSALGFGGTRGVDFRDMASELIKALDVIKGSEARMTEGGIGGTIQVETRKPNEFESNFLSVSAEGQYNDLIGNVSPKFNFVGVHKFTEDLGLLLNVTGSDKSTMIHAIRNTEWNRYADYDGVDEKTSIDAAYADITVQADCMAATDPIACEKQWWEFSPATPRYGIWGRDEKRLSSQVMLQYRLNDSLSTHVGYTYNTRDKQALDLNIDLAVGSAARVMPESVVVDELHNVKSFVTQAASVTNRTLDFAWDQTTSLLDAGFVYARDAWRVEGLVSQSTSDQDIDSRDTQTTTNDIAGIKVTLDERGIPSWDYNQGYFYNRLPGSEDDTSDRFNINDPASYRNRVRYKYAPTADEAKEIMAKLDITYIPDSDFFTIFRGGYRSSSVSVENINYEYNIIRDVGASYNGVPWTLQDNINVLTGRTFESRELFEGYDLGVDTIGTYWAVNSEPFLEVMKFVSQENVSRNDLDAKLGNFDQVVNTDAYYLQANFEREVMGLRFWGNVGLRYVETEIGANGDVRETVYVDPKDELGNVLVGANGLPQAPIEDPDHPDNFLGRKTVVEGYSDTLPSINLNLGLIPDQLVLYVGAAKVLAHPKTSDLNVNATCKIYYTRLSELGDENRNTCSAGNPALKPYMAEQWEVALNWYPDDQSIISGSYFVKDITSWIIDADTRYDVDFFGDGRLWDVKQKLNGSGVKNKGLELQASTIFDFLPGILSNMGGSANYTYMESADVGIFNSLTGEELPFPSMSKNSYNLSVFYEDTHWSARIAYNYRDEYLARATSDRSGNPVFVDKAGYMDAKLIYTFDNGLKVYIDGRNLLSEVKSENAGPGRLTDLQWSGREYSVGFSYKM
ncbi:MAG: TonB-dependent receptor [Paraglaciecola sp.]|uniref:TonB-dependent receptor n=1 Tax=Paraglaciecola sp. TaxID=1920173 RepID=UPI00273FF473|nr:TonB-dependent receptor [Paraglaciecola sp.]MDP5032763.1 TonB-dependent receptor [Paraglaciecola sp.]MDP5130567.1 TonB-dependent receptor [Paraglaciecola sp.]